MLHLSARWIAALVLSIISIAPPALAQQAEGVQTNAPDAGVPSSQAPQAGLSQEELQQLAAEAAENREADASPVSISGLSTSLNFLDLLLRGGALMIPIGVMSLLVVAIALERLFALRRGNFLPRRLRREIRQAADERGDFAPEALFLATQRYPCVASRMLRDMLEKTGRPVTEIEAVISSGAQREADRLYGNVRWLTLAAAVTPLIGLLGTVWGMIIAFYNTTQLGLGKNKAEFLAEGIYVALVTTLGGLAVAIPAAIFAHYFEGRISKMLARIEGELKGLLRRFELLEGGCRYDITARGLIPRDYDERLRAAAAVRAGETQGRSGEGGQVQSADRGEPHPSMMR